MKQPNTQLASDRSLAQQKAIVSEAALLEWIRPSVMELTFGQLTDRIALGTASNPSSHQSALHGQQGKQLWPAATLPAKTNENHPS